MQHTHTHTRRTKTVKTTGIRRKITKTGWCFYKRWKQTTTVSLVIH